MAGKIFSSMPNAEGITAVTAWMISCIFCVFCALMCYAYLLWRLRPSMLKVSFSSKKVIIDNRYWISNKGSVSSLSTIQKTGVINVR